MKAEFGLLYLTDRYLFTFGVGKWVHLSAATDFVSTTHIVSTEQLSGKAKASYLQPKLSLSFTLCIKNYIWV